MSVSGSDLQTSMLFCRLCQSLYRQPRTLPCLHSFCHDCLKQLATSHTKQGETSVACAVCGQAAPLTSAGVSGLTSNDFLARMCQEYVEEVQRTLVHSRQLSPGSSRGPASPTAVSEAGSRPSSGGLLAGRSPVSAGQVGSHSPSFSTTSPGGSTQLHSSMSPRQLSAFDYSFHARPGTSTPPTGSFTSPSAGLQSSREHTLQTLSPQRHSSSTSSSSSSDLIQQTARRLSADNTARGVGIQRRLSSIPQDVLRTYECLQHKLNSLQSASLQVTYSLDSVNMAESCWHQRKQDLKRDVQRRSAQLQFFIKRQERLLLAALDSRHTDEGFMEAADSARAELRNNLKSLMHETEVLRSVLDLGTDSEIISLSSLLLGSTVSQTPVTMTTPELHLVVPNDVPIEDIVSKDFGCLTSTLVTQTVFTPEEVEFISFGDPTLDDVKADLQEDDAFLQESTSNEDATETHTSTTDSVDDNTDDIAYIDDDEEESEEEVMVEETFEIIDGKMQIVSKTSVPTKKSADKTRHTRAEKSTNQTRHERADKHKSPALETKDSDSRGRGRERQTLGRVSSKEDKNVQKQTQEKAGTSGTKQAESIDSMPEHKSGTRISDAQTMAGKYHNIRESLRQRRRELLMSGTGLAHPFAGQVTDVLGQARRVQSLDRTSILRDQTRRSQSPASPQRRLAPILASPVVQSTTTYTRGTATSTTHTHGTSQAISSSAIHTYGTAQAIQSSAVHTHSSGPTDARRFSADGSTTGGNEEAEPTSPTSPTSPTEQGSRPVRRAISAASDRASKMEYLRETWRKRKELLIQNEAFIPTAPIHKAEDHKGGVKSPSSLAGVTSDLSGVTPDKSDVTTASEESDTSPTKSGKVKQSLKTRFSNLKQALRKNGKGEDGKTGDKPTEIIGETTIIGKDTLKSDTSKQTLSREQTVEERVLQTVEGILQKRASSVSSDTSPHPQIPAPLASTPHSTAAAKPAMAVKPHPRDPSPGPSPLITSMLEPVQEGKVTDAPPRHVGLRVTSPSNTDASKERIQQVRANMRRKKERWRSLSLT